VSGFNISSAQVVGSGPGYANLAYGSTDITGLTFVSANILLPSYIYTSSDATTWTKVNQTTAGDSTPAKIKFDSTSGYFYTVLANPSGTTLTITRSVDGGVNWISSTLTPTGLTSPATINDFTYDAGSNSYVAVGKDGGTGRKVYYNTGNSWVTANISGSTSGTNQFTGVSADGNGRLLAIDSWGIKWTAASSNLANWTTPYTTAPFGTEQSAYASISFNQSANAFVLANNYSVTSAFYLESVLYSTPSSNTRLFTSPAAISDIDQVNGRTIFITTGVSSTTIYTGSNTTYANLTQLNNPYYDVSYNGTTGLILLSGGNLTVGYTQLITAGGGNVYANNVIANTSTFVNANINNLTVNTETVTGTLNVSTLSNLQVNGGNVGQFVGINTANVLSFIDRVSSANLNLGSSLPTTASINSSLPASLVSNLQNGSMVFDTDTSIWNTQPLYTYLNGAWRQMMISQAL
jgi:hypothetical protein